MKNKTNAIKKKLKSLIGSVLYYPAGDSILLVEGVEMTTLDNGANYTEVTYRLGKKKDNTMTLFVDVSMDRPWEAEYLVTMGDETALIGKL